MAYNTGTDPTLAELITGKFIPEVFSLKVLETLKSKLVIVPVVSHDYQDDLRLGYKANIPVFTGATATEVTPGTEPTASDVVSTPTSITVDKWWKAAIEVSEMSDIQDKPDYLDAAAQEIAYAVSKKIDSTLADLFSTLSTSTVYGSDGQTMTDDILVDITETLDEADVPLENRVIIGDPSTKADMRKIDKFVRSDYINGRPTVTGQFGEIYNMPVLITNNLTAATTGSYGVILQKKAIGIVIQRNPRARRIPMPWQFRTLYVVDAIWGVAELRDTCGKSFYTRKK